MENKIYLKNVFKDAEFSGTIGNAEAPLLKVKKADPKTHSLIFGFDYDYSTHCCFGKSELEEILKNSEIERLKMLPNNPAVIDIKDAFCYMTLTREEFIEFEKNVFINLKNLLYDVSIVFENETYKRIRKWRDGNKRAADTAELSAKTKLEAVLETLANQF